MSLSAAAARHMIEHLPINVMICDAKHFTINYVNAKSRETLNTLTELLPEGMTGDSIVGKSIDVFHKHPEHQHSILNNKDNLPHSAIIRLGPEFLELQIIDVPGGFGGKDSLMLTWSVVTERERLSRMANKMPMNLMMCDPDTFDIIYVNDTSRETLKQVEHLLPIKVEEVLGANIDIFHKDPQRVRSILSDPSNLPHRGKIKLGDETLQLDVAAIIDDKGDYIGPMVAWQVITTQVKVAESALEVAATVASASTELSQNSQSMSEMVNTANEKSTAASASSEETSTNVQTVASAAEQMNASIQEIAGNMSKSKDAVEQVLEKARSIDQSAESLDEATRAMGNILEFIQDIAEQINLLALNATIESARAGEAGKGFAVVASEVKDLASQTSNATSEIGVKIAQMQEVSHGVVAELNTIQTSIEEVSGYVTSVASAIEQQTAVTRDISSNMQTASDGVMDVSKNVSGIAEATARADEASKQVQDAARLLSGQAERLNKDVGELLE